MQKMVDGILVDLTPEEIEERRAFEAAADAERVQREKEARRQAILKQLADIDARSIRPIRTGDTTKLAELEAEAVTLRNQLKLLEIEQHTE